MLDPLQVSRDWGLLHPFARKAFTALRDKLENDYAEGIIKHPIRPFEVWRHPLRQADLLARGTSKAGAWSSAHQYGLAVDFVPAPPHPIHGRPAWTWDGQPELFNHLRDRAHQHGLTVPIGWDKPHVEHPLFKIIRRNWP